MHVYDERTFVERGELVELHSKTPATVYINGNIVEIVTKRSDSNKLMYCRRQSRSQYFNSKTGECLTYKPYDQRIDSTDGIRKSLTTLRRIINLNFCGDDSELFLTLTYSDFMNDTIQLYEDFNRFKTALRYYYSFEYVCIAEPQDTGSWHLHILLKQPDGNTLYIPKSLLDKLWPHGFTYVKRLPFVDNFGAYFYARLANADTLNPVDDGPVTKSDVKGSRLRFYPAHFRIYRCSRGIQRPKPVKMKYCEARKLVHDYEEVVGYSKKIIHQDISGEQTVLNVINYEQYKKPRC